MNTGLNSAHFILCGSIVALLALTGCTTTQPTLKEAFRKDFLVGAALNPAQFTGQNVQEAQIVRQQFNSITAENAMKWAPIHPEPDRYEFEMADQFVEFGVKNKMFIVGHTLVWHSQTPRWVFEDHEGHPVDRETLLKRMRDHIHTVVGRYKGRVKGWDVVNEALNEDGTLRKSRWYRIIGEDYIAKAFEFAREADPDAELYYNDFSLENEPKRKGAISIVKNLQSKGIRVDGIGTQQHVKMDWPTSQEIEDTVNAFSALGIQVMVTELDVDMLPPPTNSHIAEISMRFQLRAELNPYTNGLPDSVQQALADRYADLFKTYVKLRDKISRVTLWGVTDRNSWLNNWPVPGRTSYPLLFDRNGQPKPAFEAVIKASK